MLIPFSTFAACAMILPLITFSSIAVHEQPTDHFFILINPLFRSVLSQTEIQIQKGTQPQCFLAMLWLIENPTTTYPQTSPELGNFGANIQQDCSPRSTHSDGFGRTPSALRLKLRRSLRLWPRLVDTIIFVFKGRVIAIIPVAFLLFLFLVKGSAVTVPVGPLFFRSRMLGIGSLVQDDGVVVAAFNSVSYLHYLFSWMDY